MKMTHYTYQWQFCPMSGDKPYDVFTKEDNPAVAVAKFHDTYGFVRISSIRKVAKTKHFEFSDDFDD